MEMHLPVIANGDADVVPGEEVLALGAETHFAERPPSFQRISRLKKLEFTPGGFWERGHAEFILQLASNAKYLRAWWKALLRCPAAVHGEHRAGHITPGVAGQENGRALDLP